VDRLEGVAFRNSQLVLVNAEALLPEVCADYGVSPDRVRFLPNVLDPAKFTVGSSREEIRRELKIPNHHLVVGHISSFSREKRHDLVLKAFAAAREEEPRYLLVLVGDGAERAASEALARDLGFGDEVRWLGWRKDVPRLLKAIDITINASDREGSCNAILESMAMGVPVVATRVGGTPEILDGGRAGILVAPDDSDALAQALLRLAQNPEQRLNLGEVGRRVAWTRHGPAEVFPKLLSIYREAHMLRKRGAS
jgi:glycosyltransferase involved in cell wall biosynthesis